MIDARDLAPTGPAPIDGRRTAGVESVRWQSRRGEEIEEPPLWTSSSLDQLCRCGIAAEVPGRPAPRGVHPTPDPPVRSMR